MYLLVSLKPFTYMNWFKASQQPREVGTVISSGLHMGKQTQRGKVTQPMSRSFSSDPPKAGAQSTGPIGERCPVLSLRA